MREEWDGSPIQRGNVRTTWNGSLSFGLVSIPVGLAPATKPAARQSDVSFRLLHRECLTPIKQKRWCPTHDREVMPDELVKGWEVAKGQYVVVEEAELEALERHDDSRSIEITSFVPVDEVDPVWLDRTYFLVPGSAAAQRRPYRLLLEAMREADMGAIGRFVRSGRESLCLVRAKGDALVLETLYLADDVYSQAEIEEAVGATEVKPPELELARQIIEGLAGSFDPATLVSDYRRDLRVLLEAKLRGEEVVRPEPAAECRGRQVRCAREAQGRRKEEGAGPEAADAQLGSAGSAFARSLAGSAHAGCLPKNQGRHPGNRRAGNRPAVLCVLRDRRVDGLQLRLEQVLVDLPVVDRDALFDAELDDRLAIHPHLLGELLRRQVIGHRLLLRASKKPHPRSRHGRG
jgi:DNA end-binding protein Ku